MDSSSPRQERRDEDGNDYWIGKPLTPSLCKLQHGRSRSFSWAAEEGMASGSQSRVAAGGQLMQAAVVQRYWMQQSVPLVLQHCRY
jgi:hypothetical protein